MGRKARIGVVGAGWWGTANHIPAVLEDERAELAGVADPSAERLDAVVSTFGPCAVFHDVREMVAAGGLDGVIVASPHVDHFSNAISAVEVGLHVLVEKPMTTSGADARVLADAAKSNNVQIVVPCGWNFKGYTKTAADLVAAGAIGRIEHVLCHMASALDDLFAGRPMRETEGQMFRPPASTWADPARAGGYGWGQMSHSLAWVFAVAASLEPAEVFAFAGRSPAGVDYYDAAALRFAGGATASLSGAATVPKHRGFQLDIRLWGSEGMLLFDVERERLEARRRDGTDTVVDIAPGDGAYDGRLPVAAFIGLCAGEKVWNGAPGEVGRKVVETLDALYRSAASGRAETARGEGPR
jgi:predicted dehydrogenase